MSKFDEILKEKLETPVPVKGKEGVTMDPMEAMVNALMTNAMKGDIASISFIRNMTNVVNPEQESKAQSEYTQYVADVADFRKGPIALHVSDNQELEKFGTLDVELIDVDELKKLSNEEIETMWKETSHLQRKENIKK